MEFSSKLLQDGVEAFSSLPGIGKRSALRIVLFLIQRDKSFTLNISESLKKMADEIQFCSRCHHISDAKVCNICKDQARNQNIICVVETIRDVIAIEETGQFRGLYHVLGGLISPIDGIKPDDINIDSLVDRIRTMAPKELILAISPTIEGETTAFYLSKIIKDLSVTISVISRGVSFGGDLEYTDELTLGRSIVARIPYTQNGH